MNMSRLLGTLATLGVVLMNLTACNKTPELTTSVNNGLATVPENQAYFRTCHGQFGTGGLYISELRIQGAAGALYVGSRGDVVPAGALSAGGLKFWQSTTNIYQPGWLKRPDQTL
jgi:hypothetical protein